MNNKTPSTRNKRPWSITLICIFYFITLPFLILFQFSSVSLIYQFDIVNPVMASSLFWLIVTLITMIYLWKMKKWAAYSYICVVALTQVQSFAGAEISLKSLFLQGLYVCVILKDIYKMS